MGNRHDLAALLQAAREGRAAGKEGSHALPGCFIHIGLKKGFNPALRPLLQIDGESREISENSNSVLGSSGHHLFMLVNYPPASLAQVYCDVQRLRDILLLLKGLGTRLPVPKDTWENPAQGLILAQHIACWLL